MRYNVQVLNFAKLVTDKIDYNALAFKIEIGKIADLSSSKSLRILLETLVAGGARKIVVDLKDLEQIDSSAIGIIINATKLIRQHKGDLVILNVPPDIEAIFKVVSLQRFIKIFSFESDVIEYLRIV
ncbi:MAG: anti-sigma factor antagonist [Spirochaetes bacterium]|nr:MAG: anti-sigma factor antagonist [Spirochaetota bacterium]